MKRQTEDKLAVGVGIAAVGLVILAVLIKLAILGLVIWGLVELVQYLSSLS